MYATSASRGNPYRASTLYSIANFRQPPPTAAMSKPSVAPTMMGAKYRVGRGPSATDSRSTVLDSGDTSATVTPAPSASGDFSSEMAPVPQFILISCLSMPLARMTRWYGSSSHTTSVPWSARKAAN